MDQLSWVRTPHGDVCLQGGHVTRWSGGGGDVLFMSAKSRFEPGQAIRGGVPVIFPWFGDDPEARGRSAHGFARTRPWRLVDRATVDGSTSCTLALEDDEATRGLWPHRFGLELHVVFGATLAMTLTVENRDATPFTCEMALHTYLTVSDVRGIAIRGLEGASYLDKVDGMRRKQGGSDPIRIASEVDRVYLGATGACRIDDPARGRTIEVAKEGSRSTIVWNPWTAKTARMSDLAPDEWLRLVCVESANVGEDAVTIAPGARHEMVARIS